MQLRAIEVNEVGCRTRIQISAPLDQWIEFSGMSWDEWQEEFGGDVFKFIKWMNAKVRVGNDGK